MFCYHVRKVELRTTRESLVQMLPVTFVLILILCQKERKTKAKTFLLFLLN